VIFANMSYEFSWNLLESTFDKVSVVLGDTMSDNEFKQEAMDQLSTVNNCEIETEINFFMTSETEIKEENIVNKVKLEALDVISSNTVQEPEEILPHGRSRSNSWPRRNFNPRLVEVFIRI